jgi:hypothetical protein
MVLAAGVLVGAVLGIRGRLTDHTASLQQHYMLLVSDLYAEGAPLPGVRQRLVTVGFANPSEAALAMSSQLAGSPDKVQQQESDQLHQFAEALVAGTDATTAAIPTAVATTIAPASPTALPTDSPVPTATVAEATPTVAPAIVPTGIPSPAPIPTDTPIPTRPSSPATRPSTRPVAATATPTHAAAVGKPGAIHTADRQPAILRQDPTSKSVAVAIIPYGAAVGILGQVKGEGIDPAEPRWWHVSYNGHDGYLYFKLVQPGG